MACILAAILNIRRAYEAALNMGGAASDTAGTAERAAKCAQCIYFAGASRPDTRFAGYSIA
jgi:hypothetical protein